MYVADTFKNFGLVSIIITCLTIGLILLANKKDKSHSVSHHVAISKRWSIIYGVAISIALVCMSLYMAKWFIPAFALPLIFSIIFWLAILLELVTTWVPLTTGRAYTIHQVCSYGAAALIPAFLFVLALSSHISRAGKCIDIAAVILMVVFILLFLFVKKAHRYYLFFQTTYIVAFYAALLSITYTR